MIHSEGVLAGEMKHGTLALVDETLPIIVIATHGSCYKKMVGVIEQLHAREARLVVLINEGDDLLLSPAAQGCLFIEVPLLFVAHCSQITPGGNRLFSSLCSIVAELSSHPTRGSTPMKKISKGLSE